MTQSTQLQTPRILTIRQPWCELILRGEKRVEYRSWETAFRGLLLIHAGKTKADVLREDIVRFPDLQYGGIVGSVRVVDCLPAAEAAFKYRGRGISVTAEGFAWIIDEPRRLPFVPLVGRLGLWAAPSDVIAKCGSAGQTWQHNN